jgi:hypothetical protein
LQGKVVVIIGEFKEFNPEEVEYLIQANGRQVGESMFGWYHKEHHTLIFQDPSNFGKI